MDQKLPAPAGTDERRMRTLSSIFELTADLLRVEDISALLQRIAEAVEDQFGFDRVSLSIFNASSGIFLDSELFLFIKSVTRTLTTLLEVFKALRAHTSASLPFPKERNT